MIECLSGTPMRLRGDYAAVYNISSYTAAVGCLGMSNAVPFRPATGYLTPTTRTGTPNGMPSDVSNGETFHSVPFQSSRFGDIAVAGIDWTKCIMLFG